MIGRLNWTLSTCATECNRMDDWDLIVVGDASAGVGNAARVTEEARTRMLLIEAGFDYSDRDSLPDDPTAVVD